MALLLSFQVTALGRKEAKRLRASNGAQPRAWSISPAPSETLARAPHRTPRLFLPSEMEAVLEQGPHVLFSQLIDYDIVIVPFESLQQEIWFSPPCSSSGTSSSSRAPSTSSSSVMALRNIKKYRKLFSPILSVRWWRLVIDEAQLAGGPSLYLLGPLSGALPCTQHKPSILISRSSQSILIGALTPYPPHSQ